MLRRLRPADDTEYEFDGVLAFAAAEIDVMLGRSPHHRADGAILAASSCFALDGCGGGLFSVRPEKPWPA